MTALQKFCEKMFLEEETSDHQRSILLVDIMNAIGFSKCEREIYIHEVHLNDEICNLFSPTSKLTMTLTGSISVGMGGGCYNNHSHLDIDFVFTDRNVRFYTPRTNNINNPPLLMLDANEEYDASFFVDEDDNFPGYVKLSLAETKTNCTLLDHCRRMNDDKHYLSNSMAMDSCYDQLAKIMKQNGRLSSSWQKIDVHGPAHTIHRKDFLGHTDTTDSVYCFHYDMWPNSANSFITRHKPNNWPSNSMLEHIQSEGCDVAPVGHHDSHNNDIQWRISFPGEHNLLLDLTDVQILCYALIKIILSENLNTSQRKVVSSFHIKHVMFWCVERCSCQWVDSNYINCLNICLAQLIEMIKARHIPHYIIENRNLFNSKMTETMSEEIVDILSKYDTTHVFRLDAFELVFEVTHYNNALLKHAALTSTIIACYIPYFESVTCAVSLLWDLYIPHNATKSLLICLNILENLEKVKGIAIQYAKYFVLSTVGFLCYAKYKELNNIALLCASKGLIQTSLNLDNSCVKLRAATFFLTNQEYSQSIEMCESFLTTFPPRNTIDIGFHEYVNDIRYEVLQQVLKVTNTEEIEIIMKAILPMYYSSFELTSLPGNYDITQQNLVWIFCNCTNIVFRGLCIDVTFMTAEKWVVPDPIQYELLSLSQDAEFPFSGIHLDPLFVYIQTKFVCYLSMGNANGMAEMLTLMNSLIAESEFTTESSCVYLNMFTYCRIKAGHHRQSVKSILQSLRIFPSRYNASSGYLKIVLQILNSLSIRLLVEDYIRGCTTFTKY
jgi:hypothetical protein